MLTSLPLFKTNQELSEPAIRRRLASDSLNQPPVENSDPFGFADHSDLRNVINAPLSSRESVVYFVMTPLASPAWRRTASSATPARETARRKATTPRGAGSPH